METLATSASKIIFDKHRHRCYFSSKDLYVNRPQLLFLPSKKHVNGRLLELFSLKEKTLRFISCIEADSQGELENVAKEHTYQSNVVHVKFQLQKECKFGERFFIVGDDPIFGLWDPESAVPLDWSDEHVWSMALDIPVGKSICFKFVLKEITGNILWQPGPDRTIQTWETRNTITILEDWDDTEYQKIIEEEPMANQNGDPAVQSELILPDDFIQPKKELIFSISDTSDAVDGDSHWSLTPEKPIEETLATDESMMMAKDIMGHDGSAATVKKAENSDNEGDLISYEGEPVLVPGLTPLETVFTKGDIQNENQSSVVVDALIGMKEAENLSLPESDEKQEPESDSGQTKKVEASDAVDGDSHWPLTPEKPIEETSATDESMVMAKDVMGHDGSAATVKKAENSDNEGDLISYEGEPVLVPGLTPLETVSTEGDIQNENQSSVVVDALLGMKEAENLSLPESDEKQEPESDSSQTTEAEASSSIKEQPLDGPDLDKEEQEIMTTPLESETLQNDIKQVDDSHSAKEEKDTRETPVKSNVLQNDIQWGRRTIQILLDALGLL